jgi:hypothetical protein
VPFEDAVPVLELTLGATAFVPLVAAVTVVCEVEPDVYL